MSTGAPTVRSLDNRMDDLEREFLIFRARMDTIVSLQKWIAGFAFASMLTVIIQMFSVSFYAGNLLEKVNTQGTAVGKFQDKIETQGTAIQEIKADLREVKKEITAQGTAFQEMKAELREIRKELGLVRDELKKLQKQ
jgi:septal ring factor EnvC (AmiA/AmiB activator)